MTSPSMDAREALRILRAARRADEVIITSMGSAREWMALAASGEGAPAPTLHPLDMVLVPSSMGQATSFGLGIAIARQDLRVIVCSGDGSLLMNLGSLVTITAEAPSNLIVIVFDNGVYEVTGSQATPGSAKGRADGEGLDYMSLAKACGFRTLLDYDDLSEWESDIRRVLDSSGPVFVLLKVAPIAAPGPRSPGPARGRAREFMLALQSVAPRPHFLVRGATASDAADIEALVELYVPSGSLLPRPASFVTENVADFVVAVEGDRVVGCGHLEDYAPSLAELRSLAVHPDRKGVGIGRAVAQAIEQLARQREYNTLFAVSNDEVFFLRLGFEKRDVPELDRERSAVSKYKGVYAKHLRQP